MPCQPVIDGDKVTGFICNPFESKENDNKVSLLNREVTVTGEPKNKFDAGDCGVWEYDIVCPECGKPAKAETGYGFMYDHGIIDCKNCGYHMDNRLLEEIAKNQQIKKIFNSIKKSNRYKPGIDLKELAKIKKLIKKIDKYFSEMGYYFFNEEEILQSFYLLAVHNAVRSRKIRKHLNSLKNKDRCKEG